MNELLCDSVKLNQPEITALIIQKGADVNYVDANKKFPLYHAYENEQIEQLKLLMLNGADESAKFYDSTILEKACAGTFGPVFVEPNLKTLKFLLDCGFRTGNCLSAFIEKNNIDGVKLVLEYPGISLDCKNYIGIPALRSACGLQRPEIVSLLIEKGADPNIKGPDGITSLMKSIINGCEHTQSILLVHPKLNVSIQDDSGNTALHYACRDGRYSTIQCLLIKGAETFIRNNEQKIPLECITNLAMRETMKKHYFPITSDHHVANTTKKITILAEAIDNLCRVNNPKLGSVGRYCRLWNDAFLFWSPIMEIPQYDNIHIVCEHIDEKIDHHMIDYNQKKVWIRFCTIIRADESVKTDIYA